MGSFVTGDLEGPARSSHCWMALRSYTLPSSAITGSMGSSCVIGQTHSFATESRALRNFLDVAAVSAAGLRFGGIPMLFGREVIHSCYLHSK